VRVRLAQIQEGALFFELPLSLPDHSLTTLAKLLARKQQLLERLQEDPGQHERDEIERQLEEIDTALNLLDEAGPGKSSDEQ
jgi:hypothetical protein